MIRYETQNSTYEVNPRKKQIRRLQGTAEPTPRIGTDGEWKAYGLLTLTKGVLVIAWPWRNDNGSLPHTITSKVVKVTWHTREDPA